MSIPGAQFGPGILILTRTDISGGFPINVGYVNEFNVDFAGNTKQLYGQNQFALVAARGTVKATGKMKNAVLSGLAMNQLFYGNTFSTASQTASVPGVYSWNVASTFGISTSSTTIAVASTTTFDADLGVIYANTGIPLQRVTTGSEAVGKYSMSFSTGLGVYNFAAAESTNSTGSVPVKITYTTYGSTSGSTLAQNSLLVTNQLIGFTPTFQLDYYTNLNQPGQMPFAYRIYSCIASKQALAFKLEDFLMPEYDFDIFANNSGQVFNMVTPNIS